MAACSRWLSELASDTTGPDVRTCKILEGSQRRGCSPRYCTQVIVRREQPLAQVRPCAPLGAACILPPSKDLRRSRDKPREAVECCQAILGHGGCAAGLLTAARCTPLLVGHGAPRRGRRPSMKCTLKLMCNNEGLSCGWHPSGMLFRGGPQPVVSLASSLNHRLQALIPSG